jgi:D-aminoacyl-tRNA deacylase
MRVVLQRVEKAAVEIDKILYSGINKGLLVLLGVENADSKEDVEWLCGKISRLRIFDDESGVMNLSVSDINGEMLVVSQFTLHAKTKKGNRPSYIEAASPELAIPLYNYFVERLQQETEKEVKTGVFGAMMKIMLINDGPVTIIIDSKNRE